MASRNPVVPRGPKKAAGAKKRPALKHPPSRKKGASDRVIAPKPKKAAGARKRPALKHPPSQKNQVAGPVRAREPRTVAKAGKRLAPATVIDIPPAIRTERLEDASLPGRAKRSLISGGFRTLGDLHGRAWSQLASLDGVGVVGLTKLAKHIETLTRSRRCETRGDANVEEPQASVTSEPETQEQLIARLMDLLG